VFLAVAMLLQPTIDAAFLSKLTPPDVVGWYSAARRLIGFLIFPASALVAALYPTLCRLHGTDIDGFRDTIGSALRGTAVLVTPVALGCLLYPEIGVALYDRDTFGPAQDNLRLLSVYLLLLYFSMPIGAGVMAAGQQRKWAAVQSSCILVSLLLDPILVPWFQQRTGNGGLGLCVASAVSEIIVMGYGIRLGPRGLFDGRFWRSLFPVTASGLLMIAIAWLLRGVSPFLAAPIAVTGYVAAVWALGGIDKSVITGIVDLVRRKFSR